MALPSLRTERPMSLWTRIVALISLLLVLGVVSAVRARPEKPTLQPLTNEKK